MPYDSKPQETQVLSLDWEIWGRKWQPFPVFLLKCHGQRNYKGLQSYRIAKSQTWLNNSAHTHGHLGTFTPWSFWAVFLLFSVIGKMHVFLAKECRDWPVSLLESRSLKRNEFNLFSSLYYDWHGSLKNRMGNSQCWRQQSPQTFSSLCLWLEIQRQLHPDPHWTVS